MLGENVENSASWNKVPSFSKEVGIFLKYFSRQTYRVLVEKKSFELFSNEENRRALISVLWKWLHLVFWIWWNLYDTSRSFLKMTWTKVNISDESKKSIEGLKESWKWIIILTHKSWIFSSYLPLFAELWPEILERSIFYTWHYNLAMNQREFPWLEFRASTIPEWADSEYVSKLKLQIQDDISRIQENWWYIFIMPSWESTSDEERFKAIFKRLISWIEDWKNIPVLANKVNFKLPFWYKQVLNSLLSRKWQEVDLSSVLTSSDDWKWKNWNEARDFYNWLFQKK